MGWWVSGGLDRSFFYLYANEELFLVRRMVELATLELSCHEVHNCSFTPDRLLHACGAKGHAYVRVANPVAPEITCRRRHVLPSLLGNVEGNLRQQAEVRLCEVVTLVADDRTLSDEDEAKFVGKVRKNAEKIGAEMRG
ncbi:MAG: hypothetical protein AB8H80_16395 [Planctomycetota bacterium]